MKSVSCPTNMPFEDEDVVLNLSISCAQYPLVLRKILRFLCLYYYIFGFYLWLWYIEDCLQSDILSYLRSTSFDQNSILLLLYSQCTILSCKGRSYFSLLTLAKFHHWLKWWFPENLSIIGYYFPMNIYYILGKCFT